MQSTDLEQPGGTTPAPSDSPGLVRKKHRLQGERICRVCGDKAVAHNFDVITCESCKTFFRRNAHKQQKSCGFTGKCEITRQTRRFCPACRLQKCFDIGMRADMILDEAERQARLEKIAQNRKKRQEAARKEVGCCNKATNNTRQCFPDSSRPELDGAWTAEGTAAPSDFPNDSDNSSPADAIGGLSAHNHHELQPLPGGTSDRWTGSSSDITAAAIKVESTLESVKKTQSRRTFQHVPNALLPCDPLMYWRLTTEEHTLITQLTVSYKDTLLQMPTSPEALEVQLSELSLEQTLCYCQRFPLKMVEFVKKMPDFRSLEVRDQMAASKFSAMLVMMLKSSALFCEERDSWIKEFGELPVSTFARVTRHEQVIGHYADFCRNLKRILKNDYSSFVLLTCMVLFDPLATDLFDRQAVNSLHDKYTILLKHYIESQFSYVFAADYLAALLDSIVEGKMVAVEMTAMFNGWKSTLDPLMVEVMNLT